MKVSLWPLEKPKYLITNFKTAKSQLINGIDGFIVPMDNDYCAKGIYDLIINKELQKKLIHNTKLKDYTNKNELKKLMNYLED